MFATQHVLVVLVGYLEQFNDDPVTCAARMIPLLLDCRRGADRVANEHRLDEPQPIVAVRHRAWIDCARGHTNSNAEDQRAMRHAAPEVLSGAPNCVQMVRKEVTGLASVSDDVGLGHRAPKRPAILADFKVLEIALLNLHGCFAVAPLMTSSL